MIRKLAPAAFLFLACDTAPPGAAPEVSASGAASTASAASVASAAPASPTPASAAAPPTAAIEATATATASAAASAAASPCPAGARKDDGARFCVTLGEKVLPISHSESEGNIEEQVELPGGVHVILMRNPLPPGLTVARLRESSAKPDDPELVERGELPTGYFLERKGSDDQRRFEAAILTRTHVVTCLISTPESNADKARPVCKSLRAF